MRTIRSFLKTSEMRSLKISSCAAAAWRSEGPTWRQAIEASDLSSASPSPPLMPPVLARET